MARQKKEAASCPICGKPVAPSYKPFCSKRCADVDLHRWLKGSYVIAGRSEAEEDAPIAERDDSEAD